MDGLFKALSLAPRSIRHKLSVAFALMAVIPMLVSGYLVIYYIFPHIRDFKDISLVFGITVFLMLLGFYLAKKIIYPIVKITAHAKGIADGKMSEDLYIKGEDEIGELSGSLNRLSTRLKANMNDLRSYGEKIKQINMEINKKVFALSGLLQIGNLITSKTELTGVFNLIVEKISQLQPQGKVFLMLLDQTSTELSMQAVANIESEQVKNVRVKIGEGQIGKAFESTQAFIVDSQNEDKARLGDEKLKNILPTKNTALLPVSSCGKVIGILGLGNDEEDFVFSDDELELIRVFGKQVAVAIENDVLIRKTEKLTVRDKLTGLYNENYIRSRLEEEIKRAVSYQRPCSFVIFELNNFAQYRKKAGEAATEKTLKKIAQTLQGSITEIDKAARFSKHQFAVILPEKNKRQALNCTGNIKQEMERYGLKQKDVNCYVSLTISEGISAAPIDGATSVELINKALNNLTKNKVKN